MIRTFGMLAAALCVVSASTALAQEGGTEGRDGFYGRVGVGAGYMSSASTEEGADASVSGMGTALNLAAGYAVMPRLVLFGEFNYEMALGPSAQANGKDIPEALAPDVSMNFLSVGPGAAYFFENDVFVQGSLLYAQAAISMSDKDETDPATGFGFRLGVGKEFALSDQFQLGAGANVFYGMLSSDVPGTSESASSNALSLGLTVSASFN